jgi:glycosyltransferase involved in cell wall biosynthesis
MTAAGWVIGSERRMEARTEVRSKWGVPQDHLVVGLVGNLQWNANKHCCYGWDLVQAVKRARREDLSVLIVGDGSGLPKLKEAAGELLDRRVFLPGPVPLDEVMNVLSAIDVASLPQSMDGVGMFRYTTKFPEYAAAGLPVVTNQTPAAYDLGGAWIWRIKGAAPWDALYLDALVAWMNEVSREDIRTKGAAVPRSIVDFNRQDQVLRTKNFIEDIFGASGKA